MVRPTINSEKHVVQLGFNNVAIDAVRSSLLISANESPTGANQVRVGAVVKAVYVEMWQQGEGMATGTSITILEKISSGQIPPSVAQMLDLHSYPNKKNVLFSHQGLSSDQNTNAVPVMRGWYKIPKGKQRFGLGDSFRIEQLAQVDGFNICGLVIYKEYF